MDIPILSQNRCLDSQKRPCPWPTGRPRSAIEEGLSKKAAKALAKEAFRMAQLEESPGELLLQEAKRWDGSWRLGGWKKYVLWNRGKGC
jgi:hypothetical protein